MTYWVVMGDTIPDETTTSDRARSAAKLTSEAAFLAEYIEDQEPTESREWHFDLLINIIDEAHAQASEAHFDLTEDDPNA